MANEEHLGRLRQGVELWNEWIGEQSQSAIPADLSGADLKGVI
jgi:hypothetical protein